jgi:hypothetical protein
MTLLLMLAVLVPADALFQYRFDTCLMLIVAAAGGVLAHKVTDASPRLRPALRFAGVVSLLAAGGWAYTESDPAKPFELASVALFALVAGEVAILAGAAVLTPLVALSDWWRRLVADWRLAVERLRDERRRAAEEAERARRSADLAARLANQPPPPPPPTRAELEAAAHRRYEERLAVLTRARLSDAERQAAEARAHQQYLRELDEIP